MEGLVGHGRISRARCSGASNHCATRVLCVYLGREIITMNDLAPELSRRKRAAWGTFKSIEDVVKRIKSTSVRAHLLDSTVLPALTYASQTWSLHKQDDRSLSVIEHAVERTMLGASRFGFGFAQVKYGIRSSDLRQRSKIKDALLYAKHSKIRRAGHVLRLNDNRWTRAVSEWIPRDVKLSNDFPSYNYMAVGFSNDDKMGDEPVTQCVFPNTGKAGAYFSYNVDKNNEDPTAAVDLTAEKENLKLIHAHRGEDGMYCHFRQMSSKESKFAPNLDKEYQLFLVRGETDDPKGPGLHSVDPRSAGYPYITERRINVGQMQKRDAEPKLDKGSDNDTMGSTLETETTALASWPSPETKFWLVRVHGILMILPWFVFLMTGVLSARYLRDNFSSSTPFGLKWWFHLGAIAILIAILQPLLALMRCHPDTGARPLFNWVHRSLGITGIIFAVIAILIAANSFLSLWSSSSWSIVVIIFYIIVTILSIVLFEILSHLKNKAPNKTMSMEMRNRSAHRYDDSGKVINSPPKIINQRPLHGLAALWVFFVLFSICVAALLIVMLTT
uniref:Cytochrome b561 domain-containing protein n=1 Tax=Angiostrongylus cantonensis TaxID=6313 RepID=A0A158PAW0_ANGCA